MSNDESRRPGRSSQGSFRMLAATDDETLRHVVRAYRELGDKAFTVQAYLRWRRRTIDAEDQPIPSHQQLVARYGSLTEALHRAVPDAPRRGLRAGAPMRVAIDSAAARRGATAASKSPSPTAAIKPADATTQLSADAQARVALVVAMAGDLTAHELLDFLRTARRLVPRPATPAATRRVRFLRPLARMLEEHAPSAHDPAPPVERKRYDELRPADTPTSERLVRAYGSWAAACRAAAGVVDDGRRTRVGTVASRNPRGPRPAPYTREEAIEALRACSAALGRRPSSRDYHEWSLSVRAATRRRGQALRLPHYGALVRLFKKRPGESTWAAVLRSL